MIYFTAGEIFRSLIYGAIYGVLCALLCFFIRAFRLILKDVVACVRQIFFWKKISDKIILDGSFDNISPSSAGVIVEIVSFTLGFILLSYIALDGLIRVYLLITVSASFYLSKMAIFGVFKRFFVRAFRLLLIFLTMIVRTALSPVCIFCRKMRTKFVKNNLG